MEAKKFRLYSDELMHNAKIERSLNRRPQRRHRRPGRPRAAAASRRASACRGAGRARLHPGAE